MKYLLGLFIALTLVGCPTSTVLEMSSGPSGRPPNEPIGVVVYVGSGGCIARSVVDLGEAAVNPNLPASRTLQGNYVFGGNVRVLGSFNQGSQQQNINSAAAAGTIGSVLNPFFGDEYARGTLYQQLGQNWVGPITNPFGASSIRGIAFGNGVYVAVADGGKIARSTDFGATWGALIGNNFAGANLLSIAFGIVAGVPYFVSVSAAGDISYSTDLGITWSALVGNPFGGTNINSISFGNGVFVAVAASSKIARSINGGVTWSGLIANPFTSSIFGVTYGNGVLVAVGDWVAGSVQIARSTDLGLTWGSLISNPFTGGIQLYTVSFGNGVFVTAGQIGRMGRSIDLGLTWSNVTNPFGANQILSVAYNFGVFQASGAGTNAARSYDSGVTWSSVANPLGAGNPIFGSASSTVNMVAVGAAGNIATAGWNAAYSLVEPVPGEPSLGTPHPTSDANRTNTLVVSTSTNTAGVWSAAVTMTGVPTGAKAAWAFCEASKAGTASELRVEAASGYTLSDITSGTNRFKYHGIPRALVAGGVIGGIVKIHLDANGQFKWCTDTSSATVQIGSAIDYEM